MQAVLISLSVLAFYMSVLFLIALIRKNNGIADVGYGGAFIVTIAAAVLMTPPPHAPVLLVVLLPLIWGVRLAVRIYRKNRGKPEDFRYAQWRAVWGKTFLVRSFFQIYMLQGSIVFVVALPVLFALIYPVAEMNVIAFALGMLLWGVGFFFEAVGDSQLDQFIRDPLNKGKIMTKGLWHYSRHPNYFGESMMWCGIALAAAGLTAYPYPFVGFLSPLLITFLLLKVSGVPLLEKHWEGNPEWAAYRTRTSVFMPLPPQAKNPS